MIVNAGDLIFLDTLDPQPEEEVQQQLAMFEEKCKGWLDFFSSAVEMGSYGIPHLFVPGNHDPPFSYAHQNPEILTELSPTTNLHNYCYQIQPHLWIVGFGGSVPVRLADGTVRKKSSYPFTTDMKEEVSQLFSLIPKGDSVILLTHCPPATIGLGG